MYVQGGLRVTHAAAAFTTWDRVTGYIWSQTDKLFVLTVLLLYYRLGQRVSIKVDHQIMDMLNESVEKKDSNSLSYNILHN